MKQVRRGRILRDTSAGDGVVIVDGRQLPFRLGGDWQSDLPPRLDMLVEVELDDAGGLLGVRPVGLQTLSREQAAQAFGQLQAHAGALALDCGRGLLPWLRMQASRLGPVRLLAGAGVLLGWFVLPTLTLQLGATGSTTLTFYDCVALLGADNLQELAAVGAGAASTGLYAGLCWLALLAPLLPLVWRHPQARFGLAGPLLMMLFALLVTASVLRPRAPDPAEVARRGGGAQTAAVLAHLQLAALAELRRAVSVGAGFWLSAAAALVLALGARRAGTAALATDRPEAPDRPGRPERDDVPS